jgi:hypothetical protein
LQPLILEKIDIFSQNANHYLLSRRFPTDNIDICSDADDAFTAGSGKGLHWSGDRPRVPSSSIGIKIDGESVWIEIVKDPEGLASML